MPKIYILLEKIVIARLVTINIIKEIIPSKAPASPKLMRANIAIGEDRGKYDKIFIVKLLTLYKFVITRENITINIIIIGIDKVLMSSILDAKDATSP